jgi:hypothetical protein
METVAKRSKGSKNLLFACGLFVVTVFLSMAMEEMPQLSNAVRIPIVLVPVAIFAYFIFQQRRLSIEGSDELEQRIQLEALSIAYPLTFLLIVLLGQIERVIKLNPEDWDYSHIWPFIFMFYLLGLMIARKRYQ